METVKLAEAMGGIRECLREHRVIHVLRVTKLKKADKVKKNNKVQYLTLSVKGGGGGAGGGGGGALGGGGAWSSSSGRPAVPKVHKIEQTGPTTFEKQKAWRLVDLSYVAKRDGPEFMIVLDKEEYLWSAGTVDLRDSFLTELADTYKKCVHPPYPSNYQKVLGCLLSVATPASGERRAGGGGAGGGGGGGGADGAGQRGGGGQNTAGAAAVDAAAASDAAALAEREAAEKAERGTSALGLGPSEERAIVTVLAPYDLSVNDSSALVDSLAGILAKLEERNIETILDSVRESEVMSLTVAMNHTSEKLMQMLDWLQANARDLTEMRRNITQIEHQNSQMEVQAKNHQKLVVALDALLAKIEVAEEFVEVIMEGSLTNPRECRRMALASKGLREAMKLKTTLDPATQGMAAVKEKFSQHAALRDRFSGKVLRQVTQTMDMLQDAHSADSGAGLRVPEHGYVFGQLEPLSQVMTNLMDLDEPQYRTIRANYQRFAGGLYTKEASFFFDALAKNVDKDVGRGPLSVSEHRLGDKIKLTGEAAKEPPPNSGRLVVPPPRQANDQVAQGYDLFNDVPVGKWSPFKIFAWAMKQYSAAFEKEQSFCIGFFGFTQDFAVSQPEPDPDAPALDAAAAALLPPRMPSMDDPVVSRRAGELSDLLFNVFGKVVGELEDLVQHLHKADALCSVRVMVDCDRRIADTPAHLLFTIGVMSRLQQTLKKLLNDWIEGHVYSIKEYRLDDKRPGILPFFARFPLLVDAMEASVADGRPKAIAHFLANVYERIANTMFAYLEKDVSEHNQKYHHLIKFENYHHFVKSLEALDVDSLGPFLVVARERYEKNLTAYLSYVVRYQLSELLTFFDGIAAFLRGRFGPVDVQYQEAWSRAAFLALAKGNAKAVKKGIAGIVTRLERHLAPEEQPLDEVWRQAMDFVLSEYKNCEDLAAKCYPSDAGVLRPSSGEVNTMLEDVLEKLTPD